MFGALRHDCGVFSGDEKHSGDLAIITLGTNVWLTSVNYVLRNSLVDRLFSNLLIRSATCCAMSYVTVHLIARLSQRWNRSRNPEHNFPATTAYAVKWFKRKYICYCKHTHTQVRMRCLLTDLYSYEKRTIFKWLHNYNTSAQINCNYKHRGKSTLPHEIDVLLKAFCLPRYNQYVYLEASYQAQLQLQYFNSYAFFMTDGGSDRRSEKQNWELKQDIHHKDLLTLSNNAHVWVHSACSGPGYIGTTHVTVSKRRFETLRTTETQAVQTTKRRSQNHMDRSNYKWERKMGSKARKQEVGG